MTEQAPEYDLSQYPPWFVLFSTKAVDEVCQVLYFCRDWREFLVFPWLKHWLRFRIGNINEIFPKLLTYQDFNGSWYEYAFETPSTALGDLTTPTAMLVLIVLVLTIRDIKAVLLPFFSSIGRKAGRYTHGEEWERNNEIRILKFGEYVFRLLYHSIISVYGIWYFWDKEWWDNDRGGTKNVFLNYPHHPIAPGMAWYYLVQSAYNVEALLSLLELSFTIKLQSPFGGGGGSLPRLPLLIQWSENVRGDFQEMFVHHVVTNMLVIGSSWIRATRVGSMVFLVHDISDVPVDLSKLANFLKWKATTALCFLTMVCCWLYFRLYILPFTIFRSIWYESLLVVENIDPVYYVAFKPVFVILMGLIILLHLAWFSMFLKMGFLLVFKWETHDLTEHRAGETQDATNRNQQMQD